MGQRGRRGAGEVSLSGAGEGVCGSDDMRGHVIFGSEGPKELPKSYICIFPHKKN